MKRITLRHPSPAMAVAICAVVIAAAGPAIADEGAQIARTISGKNIKQRSIAAKKIRKNTLTGTEIAESKLGKVPSSARADKATQADSASSATNATNATTVGGAGIGQIVLGRTASDPSCSLSGAYADCVSVTIDLPRSHRLLVLGGAEMGVGTSANADEYGTCKLQVDDADVGATETVGWGGTGFSAGTAFPQFSFALNSVTGALPAGSHQLDLACRAFAGTPAIFQSQVSGVAIGSD